MKNRGKSNVPETEASPYKVGNGTQSDYRAPGVYVRTGFTLWAKIEEAGPNTTGFFHLWHSGKLGKQVAVNHR